MDMSDAIHILVFDEEPALRAVLRSALEAEDCVVSEAGDKASPYGKLSAEPKSLVTLDLDVRVDDDGLELAHEIRARHKVPIVY